MLQQSSDTAKTPQLRRTAGFRFVTAKEDGTRSDHDPATRSIPLRKKKQRSENPPGSPRLKHRVRFSLPAQVRIVPRLEDLLVEDGFRDIATASLWWYSKVELGGMRRCAADTALAIKKKKKKNHIWWLSSQKKVTPIEDNQIDDERGLEKLIFNPKKRRSLILSHSLDVLTEQFVQAMFESGCEDDNDRLAAVSLKKSSRFRQEAERMGLRDAAVALCCCSSESSSTAQKIPRTTIQ